MLRRAKPHLALLAVAYVSVPAVASANSFRGLGVFLGAIGIGLPALLLLTVLGIIGLVLKKKGQGKRFGRALQIVAVAVQFPYPLFALVMEQGDPEGMAYTCMFSLPLILLGVGCFLLGGKLIKGG